MAIGEKILRKLVPLFVSFAFLISSLASAQATNNERLRIDISIVKDFLQVTVENTGRDVLTISSNFELGGSLSYSPVYLVLKDKEGNQKKLSGVMDSDVFPGKVEIARHHLYGRKFQLSTLGLYFSVPPGTYEIKAVYDERILPSRDPEADSADILRTESVWIPVEIE